MAPPVVIYVGVTLAVCGVVYAIHETWEPHIKPELKKVQHAAKSWSDRRRSRNVPPVEAHPPMRVATPDAHDSPHRGDGGSSPFERAIYSALQLPQERDGNNLRQRTNRSAPGVATPNETVEMTELDKSIPPLPHPTLTPGQFSVGSSSSPSVAGDPFVDPPPRPRPPTGLISPPLSHYSTMYSTEETVPFAPPTAMSPAPEHSRGLELNIPILRDLPISRVPSVASATNSWQNVNATSRHLHPLSGAAMQQSPWSGASELSSSTWTEGGIGEAELTASQTAPFAFVPPSLLHREIDGDDNFSIGSYDDMASHSSGNISRSHHSQDDEEPPSPPHYSAPMSPVEGRASGGSSAGWESVRSPSMSPSSESNRRSLA